NVTADRFGADPAALGQAADIAGAARDAAGVQPAHGFAAGVDADLAGHGFGLDLAADPPAQRDVAADAFHVDLVAVEVELQVAADAADVGLVRRADRNDVAAHALDVEGAAGDALHVDVHRDTVDLERRHLRHVQDQRGGLGAVAAV